MCKVYGYCRVSTVKQSIERQVRNILSLYPDADIRKEIYTGTKYQGREELQKILKTVKKVDTIVFDSVSRMARNADDGTTLYFELYESGINLIFIKERHIDTESYKQALESAGIQIESDGTAEGELVSDISKAITKFMKAKASADIRKAFEQSQKEVDDLHDRTKEGIETARRNGKIIGGSVTKGKKKITKKSIEAKAVIKKHSKSFGGGLDNKEVMKLVGISEPTLLKYKKEIRGEMVAEGILE